MADEKDLFAPPSQDEMEQFAPPTQDELDQFAPPSEEEMSPVEPTPEKIGAGEAALLGAAEGVSFGLSDVLSGVAGAAGEYLGGDSEQREELRKAQEETGIDLGARKPGLEGLMDAYYEAKGEAKEKRERAAEEHPVAYYGASLPASIAGTGGVGLAAKGLSGLGKAGSLAAKVLPTAEKIKKGATLGQKALIGAGEAAKAGAISGLGMGDAKLLEGEVAETAKEAALGAGLGAVTGAAIPALGSAGSKLLSKVKEASGKGAVKLAKIAVGVADDDQLIRILKDPKAIKEAKNFPELAEDLGDYLKELQSKVDLDNETAKALLTDDKIIPVDKAVGKIEDIVSGLKRSELGSKDHLEGYVKDLTEVAQDGMISQRQLKEIAADVGAIAYDKDISSPAKEGLRKAQKELNNMLKDMSPEYKKLQENVTEKYRDIKEIKKKFGFDKGKEITPKSLDQTITKIKKIGKMDKQDAERAAELFNKHGISADFIEDVKNATVADALEKVKPLNFEMRAMLAGILSYNNPIVGGALLASKPVAKAALLHSDKIPTKGIQMAKQSLAGKLPSTEAMQFVTAQAAVRKALPEIDRSNKEKEFSQQINKLSKMSTEDLGSLSQRVSQMDEESAKGYALPLQRAAEAPENSRAAIMYGLMQQPAFREVMKKLKKEKN